MNIKELDEYEVYDSLAKNTLKMQKTTFNSSKIA